VCWMIRIRFSAGSRVYSPRQRVQTSYETCPVFRLMGIVGCFIETVVDIGMTQVVCRNGKKAEVF
jgi:hypothetical protein